MSYAGRCNISMRNALVQKSRNSLTYPVKNAEKGGTIKGLAVSNAWLVSKVFRPYEPSQKGYQTLKAMLFYNSKPLDLLLKL